MKIKCSKCGKMFDPATEMARCHPYHGHAPVAPSGQNLPNSLKEEPLKKTKVRQFQSDFRLIWGDEL